MPAFYQCSSDIELARGDEHSLRFEAQHGEKLLTLHRLTILPSVRDALEIVSLTFGGRPYVPFVAYTVEMFSDVSFVRFDSLHAAGEAVDLRLRARVDCTARVRCMFRN